MQDPRVVDLDLVRLREQYQHDLFNDFLPFLEQFVIDYEFGGFLCSVRPDGQRVSTEKRVWYEGRGIWAFAYLYNNFGQEPRYLDIAGASVRLLDRSKPIAPDGFWPKVLNRDGTPAGEPDPELYGDMFVAEGLAEFAKATGESAYWVQARELVLKCERRYDQPDYYPAIGETYLGPGARPFAGARIGGVWMVFIRTLAQMLEGRKDDQLQRLLDRSLDAFLNHHYNPRFQLFNELINHDLSRPGNEYERLVYAGHAIETLWMIMYAARLRGDPALFDLAARHFRRHCEVAQDRVFGGLFRNLTDVDGNVWTMDKTLFPHQEALVGALTLVEETSDPWAQKFYCQLDDYVRSHFPMRHSGSPLWQLVSDRFVSPTPGMTRAENYHHPRFLMLNLQAVERLIARGGRARRHG